MFTMPNNRIGTRFPDAILTENPCFRQRNMATVIKLVISCHIEFSNPVILTAFLLKITIIAYMIADNIPQINPQEVLPCEIRLFHFYIIIHVTFPSSDTRNARTQGDGSSVLYSSYYTKTNPRQSFYLSY